MDQKLNPTEMIEPGSGRRCVVPEAQVDEFASRGYTRADARPQPAGDPLDDGLDDLTGDQLRERASDLGLTTSGRNADLIARIREAGSAENGAESGGDNADGSEGGEGE